MQETTQEDQRQTFHVLISFLSPSEGTILVGARDKAHCEELVNDLFKERAGLKILDIYPASALLEKEFQGTAQEVALPSNDKNKVLN